MSHWRLTSVSVLQDEKRSGDWLHNNVNLLDRTDLCALLEILKMGALFVLLLLKETKRSETGDPMG
jgi:hypothetical protein